MRISKSKSFQNIEDFISTLRPVHWVKNLLIFCAPYFFANSLVKIDDYLLGILSLNLVASSGYIINDYVDRNSDVLHPVKQKRTVTRNLLQFERIVLQSTSLLAVSVILASTLDFNFAIIVLIYFLLSLTYTLKLKKIFIVKVMTLPIFFLLRIVAGFEIGNLPISIYFLSFSYLVLIFISITKNQIDQIQMQNYPLTMPSTFAIKSKKWIVVSLIYSILLLFNGHLLQRQLVEHKILRHSLLLIPLTSLVILFIHCIKAIAIRERRLQEPIEIAGSSRFTVVIWMLILLLLTWIRF